MLDDALVNEGLFLGVGKACTARDCEDLFARAVDGCIKRACHAEREVQDALEQVVGSVAKRDDNRVGWITKEAILEIATGFKTEMPRAEAGFAGDEGAYESRDAVEDSKDA